MLVLVKIILFYHYFNIILCTKIDELKAKVRDVKSFVIWPNATIPFYIDPNHFDNEQSLLIMRAISTFAFKTCLKFVPVMTRPEEDQHAIIFINPNGIKRCHFNTSGHSVLTPHIVHVGYKCLNSPYIDMLIMRALGFNFEHNKFGRDAYISVMRPHIEPAALDLFVEDIPLPTVLQDLPYDINSVMHFGDREYSKNGYRTIKFKPPVSVEDRDAGVMNILMSSNAVKQNRTGLTDIDLKKIDIVYGPECLKRDRQEKIEICKSYPGVSRKKRSAEETTKSLRVNPDITPPSTDKMEAGDEENDVSKNLKELGVEDEAQNVLEHVYKVSSKALKNAREKYCNGTDYKPLNLKKEKRNSTDITGILEYLTEYVDNMISNALSNLTVFCQNPDSILAYQRECNWRFDNRCIPTYRSTKSGHLFHTTQHRPYIIQSTWHKGQANVYPYDRPIYRSKNESEEITSTTKEVRRKREAFYNDVEEINKNIKNEVSNRYRKRPNYRAINQASSSDHDSSASKISDETNDNVSSLERDVIQEPPSLAIKSAKVGVGTVHETKYFGAISKEANDVEREEETSIQHENKKKNYEEDKMKHEVNERNKKKIENTEISSQEREQKRAAKMRAPPTVVLSKLNREFYMDRMWPEGVVRYVITPLEGYDLENMRIRLSEVNNILKKKTCVRLEEVTEEEAKNHEDYMVLDASPDYITGRVGGKQHFGCLELFKGGQHRQHTAMMVMAMLGFYFEVARHDRDKYIRVHMRHIRPDKLHHFEKIREDATLDLPYDFNSATHPAWQFWRKIGKTGISSVATLKTLDPDGSIMRTLGQHKKLLSDLDIVKINSIYGVDCFTEPDEETTGIK